MGYFVKEKIYASGTPLKTRITVDDDVQSIKHKLGEFRYNFQTSSLEFFNGTAFVGIMLTGAGGNYQSVDEFVGNGSAVTFGQLSVNITDPKSIMVFVGGVFQSTTSFIVNGTKYITFTSAIPNSVKIHIVHIG